MRRIFLLRNQNLNDLVVADASSYWRCRIRKCICTAVPGWYITDRTLHIYKRRSMVTFLALPHVQFTSMWRIYVSYCNVYVRGAWNIYITHLMLLVIIKATCLWLSSRSKKLLLWLWSSSFSRIKFIISFRNLLTLQSVNVIAKT